MYLKKINAFGFKSFADRTEIDLKNGIIGIVGPNGSGKSNIVDAIKWVLGEQSTKNLRANGKMTDVIFSGSESRDSLSKASVALTFDNSDHYLNSEYTELEIKRILFSDGENEYYLNNNRVRLKDIVDLFIDSGASKQTFNIISQGQVQDLINMQPFERRVIFEEAAGVLKYKKRKEDSERKLEKTNENLKRINLIIKELSETVEPLKAQSEIALKYITYKKELENIEIALISSDITSLNFKYQDLVNQKDSINQQKLYIEAINKKDTSTVERLKLTNIKLDEKINECNRNFLSLTEEISKLESEKQIAIERKKFKVDDIKIENNITLLKENQLKQKNNIEQLKKDIALINNDYNNLLSKKDVINNELIKFKEERNALVSTYNNENLKINDLNNKISNLKQNLENDTGLSYAARNILNNPRLKGIHNALGKLITVDDVYSLAIETSLGFNQNVVVVDNACCAKEAINYLKDNSLGRSTFFPLDVIKPKFIESEVLSLINNEKGYIGVASELVNYQEKYSNIIKNQLGNVIVVSDIDSLNKIGKLINFRYRIVSLDGEILHTGGSITGGKNKENYGLMQDKRNLLFYEKELNTKTKLLKELEIKIKTQNNKIIDLDNSLNEITKEIIAIEEKLIIKENNLKESKILFDTSEKEILGSESIQSSSLDKEIDRILEIYYGKQNEKEILEKDLDALKKDKSNLQSKIENEEKSYREYNKEYNDLQNKLKDIEVELGKYDVKLDALLLSLNENYGLTYEKAKENYILDLEINIARSKVNSLKNEIKSLGEVNTGSIEEYNRLNKRYTFLKDQADDLEKSMSELEEIIYEMDQIMIERIRTTFDKVNNEFIKIYKILFKGGNAKLELTNPENILETGIEIKACPPGKKLNSLALLSGGEKALTCLSLLFSILNIKPTPFCILDEVEDALDEANVDVFGKYINNIKEKTQFILITHKKRTMEYADLLYGITMQESGVSKIVSVRLENM